MLGLGRQRVMRVPVDGQGRMRAEEIPPTRRPGDRLHAGGQREHRRVRSRRRDLRRAHEREPGCTSMARSGCGPRPLRQRATCSGLEHADSWATDAHKWLNVPYDSGLAFVRDGHLQPRACRSPPRICRRRTSASHRDYTPELSRRARGVEVWAALRSLGRAGLAD